jgi:hypothetical protein
MNKKVELDINNIFEFAEKHLQEKSAGYTLLDVIDKAIMVRKFMDNPKLIPLRYKKVESYDISDYGFIRKDIQPHTNKKYLIYE